MKKTSLVIKRGWITRRKNGNEIPWNKSECPDKELLRKLYLDDKKGSHYIAKQFKVSQTLIISWLKREGIKMRTHGDASKITLNGFKRDEKHPNWKGDNVSYQALHSWVRLRLGRPMKCEHCGRTDKKKYEWANISGEYKRELSDWVRLCTKCHRIFDKDK